MSLCGGRGEGAPRCFLEAGEIELRNGPLDGLRLCASEPSRELFVVERDGAHELTRDADDALGVYVALARYERDDDWEAVVVLAWHALGRRSASARSA